MVNWHLFIMTMLSLFCTRLLEPNSLANGNKIKTKLKFGINYIGKKKHKDSNGEYYDRLISD